MRLFSMYLKRKHKKNEIDELNIRFLSNVEELTSIMRTARELLKRNELKVEKDEIYGLKIKDVVRD